MENKLAEFADSLRPNPKDIERGKFLYDRVFRALRNNKKFAIDRARCLGSVGKGTVINTHLDFDCVVYLNKIHGEPPFPEIFQVFETALDLAENIDVEIHENRSKRAVALQATIDGFDFDIVPAVNYSQDPDEQRNMALAQIMRLKNPSIDGYKFSSSLSETQVDFIKNQSQFAHRLIRLAKYWMHSLLIKEYISGKSSLIELIAVRAAQDEESTVGLEPSPYILSTRPSLTQALLRFLTFMQNFHQLNIMFQTQYFQQPGCQINNGICEQRPLVLDPSNPFNNFAFKLGKKRDLMQKIELMAAESLRRLREADPTDPNVFEKLFSPQPAITPDDLMGNLPKNMVISVERVEKPLSKRTMKQTGSGSHIDHHGKMLLEHFIQDNINVQRLNLKPLESVQRSVQDVVDRQLFRVERRPWGSSGVHEGLPMTLEIPCGAQTIRVSASW